MATTTKFDIEKFTGKNDFELWKMKMEAILVQQGLEKALLSEDLTATDKESLAEMKKKIEEVSPKAYSAIILSLSDQVLRKVLREKIISGIWIKLEELYRAKTLPGRIYLKERFFGFKMDKSKSIEENLDDYTKLVLDLENLGIKVDDKDKAIILLNSLPRNLKNFKETLKYGRQTITVDEVQNALESKLLDMKGSEKNAQGEGLHIRGRTTKQDNHDGKGKSQSRSKSRGKKDYSKVKYYHCNKNGHIRRLRPERQNKDAGKLDGDAVIVDDGYESSEVLSISESENSKEWVMDSGCSYHMCPREDWFMDYQEVDGGKVLMGNNMACKVMGIGSISIRMFDGVTRILKNVRHVPELKRSLISLGTLDKSGYGFKAIWFQS
ncbi:LOW QUALITY PROTEIN: Gag-Pol-related retrotransposon family protein [Trema orientale]|uniref:Gag-Pol-related retrotransposon family protein n=1 Tax=Trema orientale TaxID=63057 RepID=A0A2P5C1B6_TREOI|nr:LOW QUALITY PROTEIN: Gag-Pol-related retrotransposon family protein [Trema orientale]